MKGYYKYIEGSIIANRKLHYAQNWVCCASYKAEYEEGNLILSDTKRAIPYATYMAKGDVIVSCSEESLFSSLIDSEISCDIVAVYRPYLAALDYFNENIEIIKKQVEDVEKVPLNLVQPLFRGLFTDVFSVFELFLSDVILCLIYNCDDKYYENAIRYFVNENKNDGKSIPECQIEIEKRLHKYFYDEIVYHRFEKIKSIFQDVFDMKIPNYKKRIEPFLHKRNNIVHRYSYSNQDRTILTTLAKQDVSDLIQLVEDFVNELVIEIENNIPMDYNDNFCE